LLFRSRSFDSLCVPSSPIANAPRPALLVLVALMAKWLARDQTPALGRLDDISMWTA
jgi:hypothetical protein